MQSLHMRALVIGSRYPASAASKAVEPGCLNLLFWVSKNRRSKHFSRFGLKSKLAQRPRFWGMGDHRCNLRGHPTPKRAKTVFLPWPEPDPSPKVQSPSPPDKSFIFGPRPEPDPSPKTQSPSPPEPENLRPVPPLVDSSRSWRKIGCWTWYRSSSAEASFFR